MTNLFICGSRGILDKVKIMRTIDDYRVVKGLGRPRILTGGAEGVDNMAVQYALERKFDLEVIFPDYLAYGSTAPHVRNDRLLRKADLILALWDRKSTGTASVIRKAKEMGKPVKVVIFQDENQAVLDNLGGYTD